MPLVCTVRSGHKAALAVMVSLALQACATEGRALRNLPGEWNLRLIECRTSASGQVTFLVEIDGPDQIEAWGLRPPGIGRAKIEVRSGVEGEALQWRFGPPKPEGWFESIEVTEGTPLGDEASLIVSMSELLVDAGFPVTLEAEAIENLEGQRAELLFGGVFVSSVEAREDLIHIVVSQPRFSVGAAGYIGFSFAELTVGSAAVQGTGASQQVNGSRIERTAVFDLSEDLSSGKGARLELNTWTFHPENLDLRIRLSECRD